MTFEVECCMLNEFISIWHLHRQTDGDGGQGGQRGQAEVGSCHQSSTKLPDDKFIEFNRQPAGQPVRSPIYELGTKLTAQVLQLIDQIELCFVAVTGRLSSALPPIEIVRRF